jgi:tetratricopeptide (TPR) repeat protein
MAAKPPAGGAPERIVLPAKEAALFRDIVKEYDLKQYKKAIKAADGVLKKFPAHGETLAMKGLTLNAMGKKEEAYDLAKQGLKLDLKCVPRLRPPCPHGACLGRQQRKLLPHSWHRFKQLVARGITTCAA